MAAYVPAIIWIICAIVCYYIAKARKVKPNLMRNLIVVFLGPLAIPLIFLAKPEKSIEPN
jgi:hypothetical protein